MLEVAVVIALFALWVTLHVWLCLSLLQRPPRWHGLLALPVPLLAPMWCWGSGLRRRALAWWLLGGAYCITLILALL